MAKVKHQWTAGPAEEGVRLDQALTVWLTAKLGQPISKAKARKLVIAGAVYLNRSRVRIASKELRAGARIEAIVDRDALLSDAASREDPSFTLGSEHILYEDAYVIVFNKPAGLPTQPTLDEARANLFSLVKKFLSARDGGEPYVGLHHRLDRDTSGVILFTKKKEANAGVADLFSKHLAQKTYLAIIQSGVQATAQNTGSDQNLPKTWKVDNYLAKEKSKHSKMKAVRSGGDRALTDFTLLDRAGGVALVRAEPRTGRMH